MTSRITRKFEGRLWRSSLDYHLQTTLRRRLSSEDNNENKKNSIFRRVFHAGDGMCSPSVRRRTDHSSEYFQSSALGDGAWNYSHLYCRRAESLGRKGGYLRRPWCQR